MNIFVAKALTVQCKMGFSWARWATQEPARSTIVSLTSDDVSRFSRANFRGLPVQCPKEVKYWFLYVMLYTTTVIYDPFHLYITTQLLLVVILSK